LLETEQRLRAGLDENIRLKASEKNALAAAQMAENGRKSAEAGLLSSERQIIEWSEKYDRELERSSILQGNISALKDELSKVRAALQKAEDSSQSYYD
jgi:hypothetical protein